MRTFLYVSHIAKNSTAVVCVEVCAMFLWVVLRAQLPSLHVIPHPTAELKPLRQHKTGGVSVLCLYLHEMMGNHFLFLLLFPNSLCRQ